MKKSHIWIVLSLVLGIAVIATATRKPSQTQVATEPSIKVGYNIESLNHAPVVLAKEKNFFETYHIRVELVPLQGGKEVRQALIAGQIDIGTGGASNFFSAIAKDAPLKLIAPLALSPTYVFVRAAGNVQTFQDLNGKIIAVSPGGSSDLDFRSALKKEGIDSALLTFVDLSKGTNHIALMEKKSVDAVLASEQDVLRFEEVGAVVMEEWQSKGYTQKVSPRTVLVANTEFLNLRQTEVEGIINALLDAHRFLKDYPEEAAQIVSDHIKTGTTGAVVFPIEQVLDTWQKKSLVYAAWYEPASLVESAEISRGIGQIEKSLTVDDLFDLRFEPKLKAAQQAIYGTED